MITKIQKLSAIHNFFGRCNVHFLLFMITKIQKLSAIHNFLLIQLLQSYVVYDYKDTKIVSNSQLKTGSVVVQKGCLRLQRYKN